MGSVPQDMNRAAMLHFLGALTKSSSVEPASTEQRIHNNFLQEVDVLEFHPEPSSQETEVAAQQTAKKPVLTWKRRKEELQNLRGEAEALQTQLEALKTQRSRAMTLEEFLKSSAGQSFRSEHCSDPSASKDQEYWRGVAKSEKRRCEEVANENGLLKARLKQNKKAFNDVRQRLKLVKLDQTEIFNTLGIHVELSIGLHERFVSSVTFDMLENRANARLADLDTIYLEACVRLPELDVDQVHVRRQSNSDQAAALEIKRTRLVPYSADRASEVVWNVMKGGMSRDERKFLKQSEDMVISDGCVTLDIEGGGVVELRSRCIMKRFVIPEGFIVVVEGITEWHALPGSPDEWRIVTRDSGWGVVHPVTSGGQTPELCQLQTGLHLLENDHGASRLYDPYTTPSLFSRQVTEVTIPSFRKMLKIRHQLMDNKLLDASI